jgi:hypothetical protein
MIMTTEFKPGSEYAEPSAQTEGLILLSWGVIRQARKFPDREVLLVREPGGRLGLPQL